MLQKSLVQAHESWQRTSAKGIEIAPQTVRNYLHETGFRARAPRKKPISEKIRKLRLEFAKAHINASHEFWKQVLFTNKSK